MLSLAAFGQRPPAFDAEIKPGKPPGGARVSRDFPPGSATVPPATLRMRIHTAGSIRFGQMTGGPGLIHAGLFGVAAVAPPGATESAARFMLRTLLEESFRLAIHYEQKEAAVYAFTAPKNGPKVKPRPRTRQSAPAAAIRRSAGRKLSASPAGDVPQPGAELRRPHGRGFFGLEGRHDFGLAFGGDSGRSVFEALADAGLRLAPGKQPADYLMIVRAGLLTAASSQM